MLWTADASLVGRDPQLPGLALLLDPEAVAAALGRLYDGAAVTAVRPRYVRYKPGTSCMVAYEIATGDGPVDLYARAHTADQPEKIDKAHQRGAAPSPLGSGVRFVPEASVIIYPFPNDHELAALAWTAGAGRRETMLRELLPEHGGLWNGSLEVLRYKPERRCVVRVRGPDHEAGAAVKFYARGDYAAVSEIVGRFASRPPLRVPRVLARSKRFRAVALEWLEGTPMLEALRGGEADEAVWRTAGAAIAALHEAKTKKLDTVRTAEQHARLLAEAARAVGEIAPDLGPRALALATRLGSHLTQRHWRSGRTIHGDLGADQILIAGDEAAVVDFDRAACGDPRLDLGTFRAKLILEAVGGAVDEDAGQRCFNAVLEGYRAATEKDLTRRLARFTAAGLLLAAVEPFRHRHREWPEEMDRVLARAEALAVRGRGDDA